MSPPVRRDRCGIDAAGLDIRNGIECALHARPAIEAQQDLSARCYAGYGRNDLTNIARAQNVETRQNRAVVIRFPTHKGEDLAGSEGDDTATPVEDALARLGAKAQPVLDPTLVQDEQASFMGAIIAPTPYNPLPPSPPPYLTHPPLTS